MRLHCLLCGNPVVNSAQNSGSTMNDLRPHAYRVLRFGYYEVDLRTAELHRAGMRVRLHGQPFQVLAMLLERRGDVVTREELKQRLWPEDTFVDFDHSLNTAINKLREALGDSADNPRFVETLPRRGYRFIAPVSATGVANAPGAISAVSRSEAEHGVRPFPQAGVPPTDTGPHLRSLASERLQEAPTYRGPLAPRPAPVEPRSVTVPELVRFAHGKSVRPMVLGVCVAVTLAALGWFFRPTAAPRVLRTMQLTDFGLAWSHSKIVTDGTRLYFVRREGAHLDIVQTALTGGEPLPIPSPFPVATLYDISPDRTTLLVGGGERGWIHQHPVWFLPLAGGTPRRLGDVAALDAAWSADGREIFFATASALYAVGKDGATPRQLVGLPGQILHLSRSPDGRLLRFSLRNTQTGSFSLWQVSTDGSNLHELLKGWHSDTGWLEGEFGGAWTPDGKYYLFISTRDGENTLWAIPERVGFLTWRRPKPAPLYEGPLFFAVPTVDQRNRIIFVVGDEPESRELMRFDATLRRFEPYFRGMPARWVRFSSDGQWVAYVHASDLTLWRSRADGSDPLQLTVPPLRAFTPDWSPDGKMLAFAASEPGKVSKICTISRDGGLAQPVLPADEEEWDPNWLADGKTLIFGRMSPSYEFGSMGIYKLNLETKQNSLLAGSAEFTKPAVSPNRRYVGGLTAGGRELMLFDSKSGQWTKLVSGVGFLNLSWSRDSRQIYFQDVQRGREQPILRVLISDLKVEQIASRDQLLRTDVRVFSLTGIAPDGSPLVTIIRSRADAYALYTQLP